MTSAAKNPEGRSFLRRAEVLLGGLALVLSAGIFAADTFGQIGGPLAPFYVIALVLAAQILVDRWFLWAAATVASLTIIAAVYNRSYSSSVETIQVVGALTAIAATTVLVLRRHDSPTARGSNTDPTIKAEAPARQNVASSSADDESR
jgi:hypothetical protein